MTYTPENGQINDPVWRAQAIEAFGGNYLIDPVPSVAVGDSSTSIELTVSSGAMVAGSDYPIVNQQTVPLPDGDANDPRVDLITLDTTATAGAMVGTPAPAQDADGNPSDFRFPNVAQPTPQTPAPGDDVVVVAAVWVPAGTGSSEEMFEDYIIPREVPGGGLNDRTLLPGRDLQFRLDTASEGDELRGDRGHQITLAQPLTINTPGITIDGLNLRYADGTATATTDDMITVDAPDVTVSNVTIDGNKDNQNAAADGITVTEEGDSATIEHINAIEVGGYAVNVSGGPSDGPAVLDVSVADVQSERSANGVVIVQNNVYRTTAEKITARNPDSGGAVLVRNGPTGTVLDTIFTTQGDYGLKLEDFGAGNDSSAPIENTRASGVAVNETPQAVASDVADLGHRELRLSDVRGRNWAATTDPAIDLNNMNSTSVENSSLIGYQGTQGIRGENANSLTISGVTIANPGTAGTNGIFVRDATNLKVVASTINGSGGDLGIGVSILARDQNFNRIKILGNDIYSMNGNSAVRLNEDQDTAAVINEAIVKNNTAAVVDNGATGTGIIVSDNVG